MRPSKEGYTVIGEMTTTLDKTPSIFKQVRGAGFSPKKFEVYKYLDFISSFMVPKRLVDARLQPGF
jgi:hypothetical protein